MRPFCSIEGCDGRNHARGFCKKHWDRWARNGDTELHPLIRVVCTVADCQTLAVARGLCGMHYQRWRKRGDVAAPLIETVEARFSRFYYVNTETGCWEWTGGHSRFGYGCFRYKERQQPAHRVAWELANGPIPTGLLVLHDCPHGDNPRCVKPDHLFLGTQKDNLEDMTAKGRRKSVAGERHPKAKVTERQVIYIKKRLAHNEPCSEIAEDLRVNRSLVAHIKYGYSWKHVRLAP